MYQCKCNTDDEGLKKSLFERHKIGESQRTTYAKNPKIESKVDNEISYKHFK